ncbi:MAG TPA: hypothetical protein VGJ15_02885 [Pirellulales bacterium]|jgi:hypothetical protein
MVDKAVQDELIAKLDEMPIALQRQVLSFASSLQPQKRPKGTPGRDLLRFAGTISKEDGEAMMKAIEEGCERIDQDE